MALAELIEGQEAILGKEGDELGLGERLLKVLERYRQQWNPKELGELARQLRDFAEALEEKAGRKGRG